MFRFLLSTLSIFVLVSSSLLLTPASARSCPVRSPTTLLSLYRNSDAIFVGTYDKTEEGIATEESESYTIVPLKKYFTITSTLKGEPRKFVVLDDSEYKHKTSVIETGDVKTDVEDADAADSDAEKSEEESEPVEDAVEREEPEMVLGGFSYGPLKPGDSVILFLDRVTEEDESDSAEGEKESHAKKDQTSEAEDRLELSDDPYGLKILPAEGIAAYEARIKELNGIFGSKDPTYAQIVAWLVRCAEDRLTRWEGTYELEASFTALDWQKERAKERAENGDAEPEESADSSDKFETRDVGFAKALTDDQKKALTNVLLGRGSNETSRTARTVAGDDQLAQLVGRWGDAKVAAGLFDELAAHAEGSPSMDLMRSISSILRDDKLTSIMERYSEIQWEEGTAIVAAEAEDEVVDEPAPTEVEGIPESLTESATTASDSSDKAGAEEETSDADKVETEVPNAPSTKQTYAEARADLLEQFKARATKLLIRPGHNEAANVNP